MMNSLGVPCFLLVFCSSPYLLGKHRDREGAPARYEDTHGRRSIGMPRRFHGIAWSSALFTGNTNANRTLFVTSVAGVVQ